MRVRDNEGMSPFVSTIESGKLDTVRVAVYARQSKARPDASEASPEAQLAAGEALAASRNWEVTQRYADIGRSGWDPSVIRPEYEAMMAAVERGEIDVVVINELSRLTRKGAFDAMTIDQKLKKHGVRLVSVLEPFLDTSNPVGEAIFALIAALAKQDSDIKAGRISGAKDEIRAVGGRHSSAPPYGMTTERVQMGKLVVTVLAPDEEFSPVVEQMIEWAFEGFSANAIAKKLEEQKTPSPGMRQTETRRKSMQKRRVNGSEDAHIPWRAQTVLAILTHPSIGGFASERKPRGPKGTLYNVIARDEAGQPMSPHKGITTGARWLELQGKLNKRGAGNPDAKPSSVEKTPTLLSGWRLLSCGLCGGSMGSMGAYGGNNPNYMCSNPVGHGGLAINREAADNEVARRVWARLRNLDLTDMEDRGWAAAAALHFAAQQDTTGVEEERRETEAHHKHVKESIKGLQADRKAGLYRGEDELAVWRETLLQYREWEDKCAAKLEELNAQRAGVVSLPTEWLADVDEEGDPLGAGSPWSMWDVFEKRRFLSHFLTQVRVGKGRNPDYSYVPIEDRVEIEWRKAPKEDAARLVAA